MGLSKPMVWCPGHLYPKNTQDGLSPSIFCLMRRMGGCWRLKGSHELVDKDGWVFSPSPCYVELIYILVSGTTSDPAVIMNAVVEGKVHGLPESSAWPLGFNPTHKEAPKTYLNL